MKITKLNAVKFFTMAFVLCAFLTPQNIEAQKREKGKRIKLKLLRQNPLPSRKKNLLRT